MVKLIKGSGLAEEYWWSMDMSFLSRKMSPFLPLHTKNSLRVQIHKHHLSTLVHFLTALYKCLQVQTGYTSPLTTIMVKSDGPTSCFFYCWSAWYWHGFHYEVQHWVRGRENSIMSQGFGMMILFHNQLHCCKQMNGAHKMRSGPTTFDPDCSLHL